MTTTAWRFSGTEGADEAVLKLKQLEAAKAVEVQDVIVMRWPQYAAEPTVRHVTEEGGKVSSLMHKFTHTGIDSSMIEAARPLRLSNSPRGWSCAYGAGTRLSASMELMLHPSRCSFVTTFCNCAPDFASSTSIR